VSDLDGIDLPCEDAIGVWYDLERALAGKNGYGGVVAEIYAYRLVPQRLRGTADPAFITDAADVIQAQAQEKAAKAEVARAAGTNMTRLLRRFVDLHEGVVISIQEGRDEFRDLDISQDFPPFDWRVHLRVSPKHGSRVAPSTRRMREAITEVAKHNEDLLAMLDELVTYRAKARLYADAADGVADSMKPSRIYDDLPPDAPTGLYLDAPFTADDIAWIKMAFETYAALGGAKRISQIMLVFAAIQRNERGMNEFLHVMNMIVLPLLRRLRLKEQPNLTKLGAADE